MSEISLSFDTGSFPVEECIHPCPREAGVLEGKDLYLCLLVDVRFPDTARLILAFPYTCIALPEDGGGTLWGWSSQLGKQWYDHKENCVHDDDERVIAWKKVEIDTDLRTILA
jgi:hypothetical protein